MLSLDGSAAGRDVLARWALRRPRHGELAPADSAALRQMCERDFDTGRVD